MKKVILSVVLALPLAIAAVETQGEGSKPEASGGIPYAKDGRGLVIADIHRGKKLFAQNCARCHGDKAQGAPNWNEKGADGKFPPPPLNGTAHAWHHPRVALVMQIRNGTKKIGGNMPAFAGKLEERDIDALITYLNSLWPEEIYQAWSRREGRN